ncbi:MAG: cysteine hydrolase [Burkholderiaceae bacterium]|nr:MAG: cysteine hydrolase [Burkholderiaceae bacterium]TAM04178.1 MAG: cysteine hydrolase [Pusillimonas sp.]
MDFPQKIVDRVVARQGALHPYRHLDPATTAFVVIDLQNYFTQPDFKSACAAARPTFGAVNKLAKALRQAGGHVVWIQTCSDDADKFWSNYHDHMWTPERSQRRLRELSATHHGFELDAGLDVDAKDLRLTKRVYSAMLPGSSKLHETLQARGVTNVLIGGTTTNVCCESTARDAMMMNYNTVMVDDALSAVTPEEHINALHGWMLYFGDVLSADDVIQRLGK